MLARARPWLTLLLLAGCAGSLEDPATFLAVASGGGSSGGSSTGGASSGGGSSGGGSTGSSLPPPNCDAPNQVFAQSCAQCHGPAPLNLGALDLISPGVASRLVGVTPPLCETTADGTPQVYVSAGQPNESYLYDKVSDAHPVCGNRMPQNLALSASDQQCVFDWISNLDGGLP